MFGRNSASVASFGAMETAIADESNPNDRQAAKPQEILILGPEGSGKTLFSKRLLGESMTLSQNSSYLFLESNLDYLEATTEGTIPTVGSDIINLKINGRAVILREVGSAMASRWDKYLPDCDCLMVVDLPLSHSP
jgi:GTPase SAR1 family protein